MAKREEIPIPMRLCCEACGKLHIDVGEFATRPHHTHSCQHCGITWRPAVPCTVGVRFLPGFRNDPPAGPEPEQVALVGKVCHCGHSIGDHANSAGSTSFGSCGKVFCNCTKFQEKKAREEKA